MPVYRFLLGLELPKTHNDGMRTLNFGQRMSFSCFYGNGGKHKTDKKKHVCQKKSANTFENSCVQNATKESHNFLMNFCALNRLDSTFRDPIRSHKQIQKKPQPEEFANYLGDVFRPDVGHNASVLDMLNVFASSHGFHSIPPFQFLELEYVLSQTPCNKATDATGVVVEMFKYGNDELRTWLLNIFNRMLKSGCFDESWRATLFTMLPKMGDTSRPRFWRPIAILIFFIKYFPN